MHFMSENRCFIQDFAILKFAWCVCYVIQLSKVDHSLFMQEWSWKKVELVGRGVIQIPPPPVKNSEWSLKAPVFERHMTIIIKVSSLH